ncbi:hypothetical protein PENTCL1PPCAC_1013, partial [Pristionchus entomophagus]
RLRLSPARERANIVQTLSENPHFTGPIKILPSNFLIDWRSVDFEVDHWKESEDVYDLSQFDR